jgi:putative glutamine amidotransferase
VIPEYGERRDCLDQAWPRFLHACGLLLLPIPNVPEVALEMFRRTDLAGLVLTGGNDLAAVGGNAPERDRTENALVDEAESRGLPVLAVCRGMQLIQHRHGIALSRIEGHVAPRQTIAIRGKETEVNSYHCFGARESRPPLEVWAVAGDGVIKAIRHASRPTTGIMWHPERNSPFAADDIALFRSVFEAA